MHKEKSSPLLKNSSLYIYLTVRVLATFIMQMVTVAIGWQVYSLTHSAFDLGLVGLVSFAPLVLFLLIVGYVADHFNRKIIIALSQALSAAAFILLALGSFKGWITRDWILCIVFLIGTANAFQGTAMQSLLPNIVARDEFTKASAGAASVSQAATILGPALGGILFAVNPVIVYALSGLFSLVATFMILFIKVAPRATKREPVTLKSMLAGISFIKSKSVILGAISLDLFAVLFGGATALLPVYAATILNIGSFGLGILRSAPAIGAMIVSFYLSKRPITHHVGRNMFTAVSLFGVATIIFALSRSLVVTFIALIFLGAFDVVSVVIRSTLVQIETPDAMRGRVNSVNQLFIGTSNQLGEFESGLTASWFGAMPAALIGGIGTIAIVLLWIRLFPPLFHVNEFNYDGK